MTLTRIFRSSFEITATVDTTGAIVDRRPLGRSEAARVAAAAPAAIAMPAIDAANGKVGGAKAPSAGLAEIESVGAKGENKAKATPISSPRISAISA